MGHESLDRVQHIALKFGLGAKLTGAGGGGCAIVLIPQSNYIPLHHLVTKNSHMHHVIYNSTQSFFM